MSIKIYDGLRGTVSDPFELAKRMREVLEPLFLASYAELVAEAKAEYDRTEGKATIQSIFDLDGNDFSSAIKHRFSVSNAVHAGVRAAQESGTWTFSPLAIGYEVSIMPNSAGGKPLALLFGEKARSYREALIQAGVVEEYGYWNSSDPDEDVSEDEWSLREAAWAELSDKSPAQVGLSFTFPSYIDAELSLSHPK